MKWAKRVVMVVAALGVLAIVAYGFAPKPVVVDTANVGRGGLAVTLDEEGRTRVRDRFVVFATVAGSMSRTSLKAGDAIEAGALITTLAPLPPVPLDARSRAGAEANVQSATAEHEQAQKAVEAASADRAYAEQRLADLRKLRASENVSQDSVNAAEAQFKVADANLRSAEFGVAAAQFRLQAARAALIENPDAAANPVLVRAPVAGRVLRVIRDSEGPVMAGEALIEIGDPARLEVVADFLSRDAVRILPRMKAKLERWGGKDSLNAVVRHVEPSGFTKISALGVEEQRVNVVLDLADGAGAFATLGDGFRVEVRVILEESLNVLKVPAGAVFSTKDGQALFAVEDGKAVRKPVQTGRRNGLEIEIVSGASEGMAVIVHPSDAVEDGKAVTPR